MRDANRANAASYSPLQKLVLPFGDNKGHETAKNAEARTSKTRFSNDRGAHSLHLNRGGFETHEWVPDSHNQGSSSPTGAGERGDGADGVVLLSAVPPPGAVGEFVYVVQCESTGRIKVGQSGCVAARLQTLKFEAGGKSLRLVAWWRVKRREARNMFGHVRETWSARYAEIDLHAKLHPSLIAGEWFHGDARTISLIDGLRSRSALPVASRATLRAPRTGNARRRWLEAFYDELAATGSTTKAKRAAEGWGDSRRRIAKLKLQIASLKRQNEELRSRRYVDGGGP